MDRISVTQAAQIAGVGKSTVRRAIKRGELPAELVNGPNGEQFMVSVDAVQQWTASRGAPPHSADDAPLVEELWSVLKQSQETTEQALLALRTAQLENEQLKQQVSQLRNKLGMTKPSPWARYRKKVGLWAKRAR